MTNAKITKTDFTHAINESDQGSKQGFDYSFTLGGVYFQFSKPDESRINVGQANMENCDPAGYRDVTECSWQLSIPGVLISDGTSRSPKGQADSMWRAYKRHLKYSRTNS